MKLVADLRCWCKLLPIPRHLQCHALIMYESISHNRQFSNPVLLELRTSLRTDRESPVWLWGPSRQGQVCNQKNVVDADSELRCSHDDLDQILDAVLDLL